MYSITTGEQMRVLNGHNLNVVGMAINPANALQLYSFGKDRKICLWDYNDAIVLSSIHLDFSIEQFTFHPKQPHIIYLSSFGNIQKNGIKSPTFDLYLLSLQDAPPIPTSTSKTKKGQIRPFLFFQVKLRPRSRFLVTPLGDYIVIQSKEQWKLIHLKTMQKYTFKSRNHISCISVHPNQQFVATGDDRGEITSWYVFNEERQAKYGPESYIGLEPILSNSSPESSHLDPSPLKSLIKSRMSDPVTTVVHWHSHRVNCINFDANGTHMYSGGKEMVLVVWQLESGRRDFLPRLGSPIQWITQSPDGSLLGLCCTDNTIKIVSSRNYLLQVQIDGIILPPFPSPKPHLQPSQPHPSLSSSLGPHLPTGLVFEPRHNSFVFSVTNGQLQFYSVQEDRHIMKIQVGEPNIVKVFDELSLPESIVTQVAFSSQSQWMATINTRDDQLAQSSLKFWYWQESQQQYQLHTQHQLIKHQKPISLAYHPSQDLCAVSHQDGKFRLWRLKSQESHDASNVKVGKGLVTKEARWVVDAIGMYRDLRAKMVAFSSDGSLLAVSYENIITLWNPENNTLLHTLMHSSIFDPIKSLAFIYNTPYLVSCSNSVVLVWDLLKCQLHWSHLLVTEMLAVDPKSDRFAVYSPTFQQRSKGACTHTLGRLTDGYIILFSASRPQPINYWILPALKISSLAFLPPKNSTFPANSRTNSITRHSSYDPVANQDNQSALIYLNGRQELKFLLQVEKADLGQTTTSSSVQTSSNKAKCAESLSLEEQKEFLTHLNAKKLVEGPSIFKLMYGDHDQLDSSQIDEMATESSQVQDLLPKPNQSNLSLPPIVSKTGRQQNPSSMQNTAWLSPALAHANQLAQQLVEGLYDVETNALPNAIEFYGQLVDALLVKETSSNLIPELQQTSSMDLGNITKESQDLATIIPTSPMAASKSSIITPTSIASMDHSNISEQITASIGSTSMEQIITLPLDLESKLLELEMAPNTFQEGISSNQGYQFMSQFFTENTKRQNNEEQARILNAKIGEIGENKQISKTNRNKEQANGINDAVDLDDIHQKGTTNRKKSSKTLKASISPKALKASISPKTKTSSSSRTPKATIPSPKNQMNSTKKSKAVTPLHG